MKILRLLDRKNYDVNLPLVTRECVRAIIIKGSKIALLKSDKRHEYKLPGGGIDDGEDNLAALFREVMEETGLVILSNSVKEYGTLIEIKKDIFAEAIFKQISHYYLCDVKNEVTKTNLSQSEMNLGYQLIFVDIEEAINSNDDLLKKIEDTTYIERETYILKLLRDKVLMTN